MWPMLLAQAFQGTQKGMDAQTESNMKQRQMQQQQAMGQTAGQETPALDKFSRQNPSMMDWANLFAKRRQPQQQIVPVMPGPEVDYLKNNTGNIA